MLITKLEFNMKLTGFYKLLTLVGLTAAANIAIAGVQFSDGFESGNLSHSESGIDYGQIESAKVSSKKAKSGSKSLQFHFVPNSHGNDAFSEVRMTLPRRDELWIKYDLFIPTNYQHRDVSPANNKFLAVYRDPYTNPGFQVNFSLEPDGSGGSWLAGYINHKGNEAPRQYDDESEFFITDSDLGKWMSLIMHIKVPSGKNSKDTVMQMWKNGHLVANYKGVNAHGGDNKNYIDELYLLGWSNSGFKNDTYFYLDNIVISDSPLVDKIPMAPTEINLN